MKQIFVGSETKNEQQSILRKLLQLPKWIQIGIVVLIIIVPFLLPKGANGNYSNVALVETFDGTGSAIYIGNNMLLTAAHVVSGMDVNDECTVSFIDPNDIYGRGFEATATLSAVGNYRMGDFSTANMTEDYALLVVQHFDLSKIVGSGCAIGQSANVKVSEAIKAEGFPNGEYSNTTGTINNITGGITGNSDLFVVDAGAWPGNSGGALFNQNDQLIGIVTMGGTSKETAGMTFVLKIDRVASQLQSKGFSVQ